MPAAVVAQALPYVNWVVLVALGVGSFGYAAVAHELTDATRGYLRFTAFCAAVLGALALLADLGLPAAPAESLAIATPAPELAVARRLALAAFAVLALAYVFALRRRTRTFAIAVAALTAAGVCVLAAAGGWAPSAADALPLALQLAVLAAATGGALAALVLGHWYLVTPRLSERPLIVLTRVLTGVVAFQLALFVIWTTLGGGPAQGAFEALTGGAALFVWLRLFVGLGFPLVLAWMALRTAMTRSMESATGLLYLGLAAVVSGTIAAAALYVGAGLLV